MHRLAALLLCSLFVVVAAMAAPAPVYKPSKVWFAGWDEPLDSVGDCRFVREEKLAITVPGKGHDLDVGAGRMNAPRLLRGVAGDFVAQVRVSGDFGPPGVADYRPPFPYRRAGLLLSDGKAFVRVLRGIDLDSGWQALHVIIAGTKQGKRYEREWVFAGPKPGGPMHLRLERKNGSVAVRFGEDGKRWRTALDRLEVVLARNAKVGVIAEATASGIFKPVFDEFSLTPLK